MKRVALLPMALCLSLTGAAGAAPPRPPVPPPAPILFVRLIGPAGMQVTLYPGGPGGRVYPAPVTVGLRPGYIYRVKLTGFRDQPGLALFPSLEVRGSLQPSHAIRLADHPAPVVFGQDDLSPVLSGGLLTKVVFLEHPDQAIPAPSRPDQPLEMEVSGGSDPIAEARLRGRPVLIARLGERELSDAELFHDAIPGTVLLPGATALPPPACRPFIPWACVPVFDPRLGPRPPEEECLHDGGDVGLPAGIGADGQAHNVDPSDTVAAYSDNHGGRHLAISNRVCLCVPRFVAIRAVTLLSGYEVLRGVFDTRGAQGQALLAMRQPPVQQEGIEVVQLYRKPYGLAVEQAEVGPLVVGRVEGLNLYVSARETIEVEGTCRPATPPPPEKPLQLCKTASAKTAKVGDVVTFTLKYTNPGGQPIADVVVTDSLTGRLEYVPGSAKSDRDAAFTTQVNPAGSLVLRWEIRGRLMPGQTGTVTFQARVR